MARLNDRPSYRASTIASSRYASATPGITSDQENQDPSAIRMSKGKGKERASGASSSRMSLPTPTSGSSNGDARGQKRKRTEIPAQEEEEEEVEEEDEQEEDSEAAMYTKFNKYFDPMQSTDLRRDLKKRGRALARGFNGT